MRQLAISSLKEDAGDDSISPIEFFSKEFKEQ
jgi:hypothetical protein